MRYASNCSKRRGISFFEGVIPCTEVIGLGLKQRQKENSDWETSRQKSDKVDVLIGDFWFNDDSSTTLIIDIARGNNTEIYNFASSFNKW
jgi:hypothetical protein